jgi:NitT/TauT family transport system substrate-binding protein
MRSLCVITAVATALLVAACGGSDDGSPSRSASTGGNGGEVTPLTLRLDYFIGSEHAPIYYALQKGWYRDAGIDLKVQEGNGSTTTVKLVGTGKADIGLATADAVLAGRVQGIPDKVVAILYQRSPNVIISLPKTNINSPTDLYGKKLAVIPASSSTSLLETWFKLKGVDKSKVTEVPLSGSVAQGLKNGQFDAGIAYTYNDQALLKSQGVAVNVLPLEGASDKVYSAGIIAADGMIEKSPDVVKAFVSTTLKAYEYAETHQEEVVDGFLQEQPQLDRKYSTEKFSDVLSYLHDPVADQHCIGWMSEQRWEEMQKVYADQGLIPASKPVTDSYTNEFVGC